MKYSNHNNMNFNKFEPNYDELENSIVDSLSEVSIASNIPINTHNQAYLNNTISEVISLYLWSTDLSTRKNDTRKNKKIRPAHLAWDADSLGGQVSNYSKQINLTSEDTYDDVRKQSPKVSLSKRSNSSLTQLAKDDAKNSKIMIPSLDLSYLNGDGTEIIQVKSDNENKKVSSKQKSYENLGNHGNHGKNSKIHEQTSQHRSVKDDIEVLLKELKLNKYQSSDVNDYYDHAHDKKLCKAENDKLNLMAINLKELLGRLWEKRKQAKRNMPVDKMTRDEIQSEKIDTQKELLTFEEKHGRPITKLEKDLMRPLYDHYRKVKRLMTKTNGSAKSNQSANEAVEAEADDDEYNNLKDNKHFLNLHSYSLMELMKEKEFSLQEKTKLKEKIKNFETDFIKQTGRALAKEDREFHKEDFERYKVLKAKIKLIDVLIEKSESGKK